MAEPEVSRTSR